MKKWIKRLALLGLAIILLAALLLHLFLTRRLGAFVQSRVIPALEERLDVEVGLDGASVNVLRGSASLSGLRIGNPAGFGEPQALAVDGLSLDLGLKQLLFGGVAVLSNAALDDALLVVERNAGKEINLRVLAERLQPAPVGAEAPPPTGEPEPGPEPPAGAPQPLPKALIEKVRAEIRARYIDRSIRAVPLELNLDYVLEMSGVGTVPRADGEWGQVSLTGALAGKEGSFVTSITGQIAPISDPARLSFDLTGAVADIDPATIGDYLSAAEFGCSTMALDLNLVCRDGSFDKGQSRITFRIDDVELKGRLAEDLPAGIDKLPRVSVPVSLGGTLAQPELDDFLSAFLKVVAQNLRDNAGVVLKGVLAEKLEEELGDKLGGEAGGILNQLIAPEKSGAEGENKGGNPLGGILQRLAPPSAR